MEQITPFNVLGHGLTLFTNTTTFLLSIAAIGLTTYYAVKISHQIIGCNASRQCKDCGEDLGHTGMECDSLIIALSARLSVILLGVHVVLTVLLLVASYWTSMGFRLCVLSSMMGILALEIAIPATVLVLIMLWRAETATRDWLCGTRRLSDDPPTYETIVRPISMSHGMQGETC